MWLDCCKDDIGAFLSPRIVCRYSIDNTMVSPGCPLVDLSMGVEVYQRDREEFVT